MKRFFFLAAIMAAFMMTACSEQQTVNEPTEPSFSEVLKTRRSVRNFDPSKTISQEEVRALLAEVQEAPSWANQQSSKYYVAISTEKLLTRLATVGVHMIMG